MLQPKLYYRNNILQKNDIIHVLDNYFHLVRWGKQQPDALRGGYSDADAVIDIGCGLGDVTCELLLPRIPESVDGVVGVDFSDDMLDFARSRWSLPRVTFGKLDLTAHQVPVDYEEAFRHAFSFYCLHWIQEQRRAVKIIYELLVPGGDVLLCFLASNPIYTIYERMAKNNKWSAYMQDYKKYVSPYHHSNNAAEEFSDILKKTGFKCQVCEILDRSFTYPNFEILKQSVRAVNPFMSNIPECLWEDHMSDYVKEVRRTKGVKVETNSNNNDESIYLEYKVLVVYAVKPLKQ